MILCDKCAKPIRAENRMAVHFVSVDCTKPNQISAIDVCDKCAAALVSAIVACVQTSKNKLAATEVGKPASEAERRAFPGCNGPIEADDIVLPAAANKRKTDDDDNDNITLDALGIVPR
jgi:hypothetical protein